MLKLNASYSKKVPADGEYISQSYPASIEVELPDKVLEYLHKQEKITVSKQKNTCISQLGGISCNDNYLPGLYIIYTLSVSDTGSSNFIHSHIAAIKSISIADSYTFKPAAVVPSPESFIVMTASRTKTA